MASAQRSTRQAHRLRAEQVFLLVLAAHVVVLCLFRLRPGAVQPVADAVGPVCVFVSPSAQATPWEGQLRAWSDLADPSLLTLPSTTHGFSLPPQSEQPLPQREPPAPAAEADLVAEAAAAALRLSAVVVGLPDEIGRAWAVQPPPPPGEAAAARLPAAVAWRLTDGTLVTDLPRPSDEEVKAAAAAGTPTAPTRIEVSRDIRQLRIRVVQRSGNAELDRLAVRALTRAFSALERRPDLRKGSSLGASLPDTGQSRDVEVEWRVPRP